MLHVYSLIDLELETSKSHIIERTDFVKMEIIGQFNCGFILTRLIKDGGGETRVFIVDQHASDERFRLETLQGSLSFTTQNMLIPVKLRIGLEDLIFAITHEMKLKALGFGIKTAEHEKDQLLYMTTAPVVAGIQLNENGKKRVLYVSSTH